MEIWYNIVRYYTSADLRPTRGRTISLANHAHPPEGIMSEGHGIMSVGYYISVGYYTSADLRPTKGRKISTANHVHLPVGICTKAKV